MERRTCISLRAGPAAPVNSAERGTALLVVALFAAASATASVGLAAMAHNAVREHAAERASLCAYYASVSAFSM